MEIVHTKEEDRIATRKYIIRYANFKDECGTAYDAIEVAILFRKYIKECGYMGE